MAADDENESNSFAPTKSKKPAAAPPMMTGTILASSSEFCDGRCLAERRLFTREFLKRDKNLLTLIGFENVLQRSLGSRHWLRFAKAVKASAQPEKATEKDFDPSNALYCLWCSKNRLCLGVESEGSSCNIGTNKKNLSIAMQEANHGLASSLDSFDFHKHPYFAGLSLPNSSFINNDLEQHQRRSGDASPLTSSTTPIFSNSLPSDNNNISSLFPLLAREQLLQMQHSFLTDAHKGEGTTWDEHRQNAPISETKSQLPLNGAATNQYPFATGLPGFGPFPWMQPSLPLVQQPALQVFHTGAKVQQQIPFPINPFCTTPPSELNTLQAQQLALAQWQMSAVFQTMLMNNSFNGSQPFAFTHAMDLIRLLVTQGTNQNTVSKKEFSDSASNVKDNEETSSLHQEKEDGKMLVDDEGAATEAEENEDQPLDLSVSTAEKTTSSIFDGKLRSTGTPNTSDPKSLQQHFSVVTKKAYSADDLEKAVRDIRSGQLGTRRASVVYNIPRSTLRNKIYKLDALEGINETLHKRRRLKAFARRNKENPSIHNGSSSLNKSKTSSTMLMKNNLSPSSDGCSSINSTNLAEESTPIDSLNLAVGTNQEFSCWPAFAAQFFATNANAPNKHSTNSYDLLKKISSSAHIEGRSFSHTRKEIKDLDETVVVNKPPSPSPPACDDVDGKRQRPKRGQYRKYDKDALDKAVASVKSGEMSVHRAGSFYGVPHSTLEYKVKERNLLRCKIKKQSLLSSDSSSSLNNINPDSPPTSEEGGAGSAGSSPQSSPSVALVLNHLVDSVETH